ncbi:hypothetical protein GGR57DRAFT_471589 [Xylariaceae sp. FL1272]|nr:hypothetical protein GGR57DRAFT_471589 [Xylariaceae sp. FL1272]
MAIKGNGVGTIASMWVLTGLVAAFLLLRLYTRLVILRAFGGDDVVFILAFLCLLLMTSFYTKSATLGLGQSNASIGNEDDIVEAILWEAIGQTFTVLGTAIAKWSLGLFLLRLVVVRWQRNVVIIAMGSVLAASISVLFAFWLQCRPFRYLWDRRIPGYCPISAIPASTVLNVTTVIVDFVFAFLPWVFIWKLQMNKREKYVILGSMSLGIFAAASGIKRALEVGGLSSPNYLRDTVGLLIWSAIEHSVTMICICIPVCMPLFKATLRRAKRQKGALIDEPPGRAKFSFSFVTFGGSGGKRSDGAKKSNDLTLTTYRDGTSTAECYAKEPAARNSSDEENLLFAHTQNSQAVGQTEVTNGIHVTNEVHVSRTG